MLRLFTLWFDHVVWRNWTIKSLVQNGTLRCKIQLDRDFITLKKEMTEAMIVSSVFAFSVRLSVSHLQVTVFDLGTKYFGWGLLGTWEKNATFGFSKFWKLRISVFCVCVFLLCLCIGHRLLLSTYEHDFFYFLFWQFSFLTILWRL